MPSAFEIRAARPGDLAPLDALYARSYPRLLKPDYPPSVLVTALPLISRAQPALLASGTYFVAETPDGQLIGAGGWTRTRRARTADIRHFVTDADHLRQGVGRALMQEVFATAAAARFRHLLCKSTFTAVPFYAAQGFRALDPYEVELRPGVTFPAIAMERALSSAGT